MRLLKGASRPLALANCSCGAEEENAAAVEWMSFMSASRLSVSAGRRGFRGLEVGLMDSLDEAEAEGVWYGFLAPNSFSRSGMGGASPVTGSRFRIKLVPRRGGGGRDRSGPSACLPLAGEALSLMPRFEGRRAKPGSEGRRGKLVG